MLARKKVISTKSDVPPTWKFTRFNGTWWCIMDGEDMLVLHSNKWEEPSPDEEFTFVEAFEM